MFRFYSPMRRIAGLLVLLHFAYNTLANAQAPQQTESPKKGDGFLDVAISTDEWTAIFKSAEALTRGEPARAILKLSETMWRLSSHEPHDPAKDPFGYLEGVSNGNRQLLLVALTAYYACSIIRPANVVEEQEIEFKRNAAIQKLFSVYVFNSDNKVKQSWDNLLDVAAITFGTPRDTKLPTKEEVTKLFNLLNKKPQ